MVTRNITYHILAHRLKKFRSCGFHGQLAGGDRRSSRCNEARTQHSCHHMQSSRHEWVRVKEGGLSQLDCKLFGTARTQAGTRGCGAPSKASSTGTAGRPLLPRLDRGSVLRPAGTRPHCVCRAGCVRGGRHLQGNRVRCEARSRGAAQGHGACSGTSNRRSAGDRTLSMGTQHDGSAGDAKGTGGAPGVSRGVERDDVRSGYPARPNDGHGSVRYR
jgi:hypothetical protein